MVPTVETPGAVGGNQMEHIPAGALSARGGTRLIKMQSAPSPSTVLFSRDGTPARSCVIPTGHRGKRRAAVNMGHNSADWRVGSCLGKGKALWRQYSRVVLYRSQ